MTGTLDKGGDAVRARDGTKRDEEDRKAQDALHDVAKGLNEVTAEHACRESDARQTRFRGSMNDIKDYEEHQKPRLRIDCALKMRTKNAERKMYRRVGK